MFIREITTRFRNYRISVTLDDLLLSLIDDNDKISTSREITFNLYRLIFSIGTIQTRRFAPSNRMKFLDYSDMIEKIYDNTNEFRIRLDEIREKIGNEKLNRISEDFGAGISIVIAEKLFNIKFSTIQRIHGTDKRPDWKCQTLDNRTLIVESKGSSSQSTSNNQEVRALQQKLRRVGDVRIASMTVLNENKISTNRFIDPPIETNNIDNELQNKILRAGHYSSVFSFLGFSLLSKYYSQMRNRLLNQLTEEEQIRKNNLYFKLREKYPIIEFNDKVYSGSFFLVKDSSYMFVGVDRQLLSYEGFLEFEDYQQDTDESIAENHYIQFQDGILIVEINNISVFENIIDKGRIQSYQDNVTIMDIDSMNEISFEKYIRHLLNQTGFITESEVRFKDAIADILAIRNNQRYVFEIKLSNNKRLPISSIQQLFRFKQYNNIKKTILITNSEVYNKHEIEMEGMIIIDREILRMIIKDNYKLIDII